MASREVPTKCNEGQPGCRRRCCDSERASAGMRYRHERASPKLTCRGKGARTRAHQPRRMSPNGRGLQGQHGRCGGLRRPQQNTPGSLKNQSVGATMKKQSRTFIRISPSHRAVEESTRLVLKPVKRGSAVLGDLNNEGH